MTCCAARQRRFPRLTNRAVAASIFLSFRAGAPRRPDATVGPMVSSAAAPAWQLPKRNEMAAKDHGQVLDIFWLSHSVPANNARCAANGCAQWQ
jgi:hypothetical protein